MSRLVPLVCLVWACTVLPRSAAAQVSVVNIDQVLTTCPASDPAYATIRADFDLRRNGTRVATIPCALPLANQPYSAELSVVQALRVMYHVDRHRAGHLPWTLLPLYDWLKSRIAGINIDDSATTNSCCVSFGAPKPHITLVGQMPHVASVTPGTQWLSYVSSHIGIIAHEARHTETGPHVPCSPGGAANCDPSYDESALSPYGISYWLERAWLTGELYVGLGCLGEAESLKRNHRSRANGLRSAFVANPPPELGAPPVVGGGCAAAPTTDNDGDLLDDAWERAYGLDPGSSAGIDGMDGDADADGVSNFLEFAAGTHPKGIHKRYLAEGATSSFFKTRLALLNPTEQATNTIVQFQKADGTAVIRTLKMAPLERVTIQAAEVPGLATAEFSTAVESDGPVVVDRMMTWDGNAYGSHAETSVAAPALNWYLAEGSTNSFNLFYLLQNAQLSAATVEVTFLLPAPARPVIKRFTVQGNSRFTIWVNQISGVARTDVSAVVRVTNGVPIIVERAMYLDAGGQAFGAGHESMGITDPSPGWFLAEGATGNFFDLFILVANPNTQAVSLRATYLLPSGERIIKDYVVAAQSRFTIWVDQEDARLANTAVSTTLASTGLPIIVERAMWWPGPSAASWYEAHNTGGANATGTKWALAEGESSSVETYILIANTSGTVADVRVRLLFEGGGTAEGRFTVAPNSRFNVAVAGMFPAAVGRRYGAIVESLGTAPAQIVVERSMYANSGGAFWAAGANAIGTRLEPAGNPVLVRNRSDPLLLRLTTTRGDVIEYFGDKDDNGDVASLRAVRVESSTGDETSYSLDAAGRVTHIRAPNGVVFEADWQTAGAVNIRAVAPDGAGELVLPVEAALATSALPAHVHAPATTGTPVVVNVTTCGAPTRSADVTLRTFLKPVDGAPYNLGKTVGWETSTPGRYEVRIPARDPASLLSNICNPPKWIDATCKAAAFAAKICNVFKSALTRIPLTGYFGAACQAIEGIETACSLGPTIGIGGEGVSVKDLVASACNAGTVPALDRGQDLTMPVDLEFTVIVPGSSRVFREVRESLSPVGRFADVNMETRRTCVYDGPFSAVASGVDCFGIAVSASYSGTATAVLPPGATSGTVSLLLTYQFTPGFPLPQTIFVTIPVQFSSTTFSGAIGGTASCSCVQGAAVSLQVSGSRTANRITGTVTLSPNYFCGIPGASFPFTAALRLQRE